MQTLKNIVESLLFVSEEPLSLETLKRIIDTAETKDIRAALNLLMEDYGGRDNSFYLSEVAGGYQLRTRPEYAEWIKRLIQPKPQRLSRAALETLAIIAYKQPVIRSDVEHIRGVDSGAILRMLLERKLIRVLGRKEVPGRPLIYATTKIFLEIFGLRDLKDLPSPKEIAELNDTPHDMEEAAFFAQTPSPPQPGSGSDAPESEDPGHGTPDAAVPDPAEISSEDIPEPPETIEADAEKSDTVENGEPALSPQIDTETPPAGFLGEEAPKPLRHPELDTEKSEDTPEFSEDETREKTSAESEREKSENA